MTEQKKPLIKYFDRETLELRRRTVPHLGKQGGDHLLHVEQEAPVLKWEQEDISGMSAHIPPYQR